MNIKSSVTLLAAALLATSTYASNYSVGGVNQKFFYLSNWGPNSHTINRVPSMEEYGSISVGAPGAKPAHIVPDPQGRYVFTVNHGGNYMSVLDAKTGKFIKQIKTGSDASKHGQGHQYYWSADGRYLWVTELDDGTLVEIDSHTLDVSRRVKAAEFPYGMIPAEKEGHIFVLGQGKGPEDVKRDGNKAAMIRISDFSVVKEIPVGQAPHEMEYFAGKVYCSNIAIGKSGMTIIDAKTGDVLKTMDMGFENPHFTEAAASNGLLVVASKSVPELALLDSKTDTIVARWRSDDPNVVPGKTRHPTYHPSGDFIYFPLGYKDGSSRIIQLSVPDLKVVSVSAPAPSNIHALIWNNIHNKIYASTEGNAKAGIPHGVTVYTVDVAGKTKKIADIYADVPEGENMVGHHGSLD